MADDRVRWLARPESRRVVGRGIALFLASLLLATNMTRTAASNHAKGERLTPEEDAKGYAARKAALSKPVSSPWFNVLGAGILAGAIFLVLETSGMVIGVSVGAFDDAMARRAEKQRGTVVDDTDA